MGQRHIWEIAQDVRQAEGSHGVSGGSIMKLTVTSARDLSFVCAPANGSGAPGSGAQPDGRLGEPPVRAPHERTCTRRGLPVASRT